MLTRVLAIAALTLASSPAFAEDVCSPDNAEPFLTSTIGLAGPQDLLSSHEFTLWDSGFWRGRQGLQGCATPHEMKALMELLDAVRPPLTVPNPVACRALPQFPIVVTGPGWRATWTVPCPAERPSEALTAVLSWMAATRLTAEFERAKARPVESGPCVGGTIGGPPNDRVVYLHPGAWPPTSPIKPARDPSPYVWSWIQAHRDFTVLAIPGPVPLAEATVTLELASGQRITQSTHNVVKQGGPGRPITPPLKLTLRDEDMRKIAESQVVAIHQSVGGTGTESARHALTRPQRKHLKSAMACAVSRTR